LYEQFKKRMRESCEREYADKEKEEREEKFLHYQQLLKEGGQIKDREAIEKHEAKKFLKYEAEGLVSIEHLAMKTYLPI